MRRVLLAVGCGIVSELGLIGYLLFSWERFGNLLEFQAAVHQFWHTKVTYPFHIFVANVDQIRAGSTVSCWWTTSSCSWTPPRSARRRRGGRLGDRALPLGPSLGAADALLRLRRAPRPRHHERMGGRRGPVPPVPVHRLSRGAAVLESLRAAASPWLWPSVVASAAIGLYVEGLFHMAYWVT